MVRKAFKPEQIIKKLREVEVFISQGATAGWHAPTKDTTS